MKITSIKNDADYEKALQRIDEIMDAAPDSLEGEELDRLSDLICEYETKQFKERLNITQKDMQQYISENKVKSDMVFPNIKEIMKPLSFLEKIKLLFAREITYTDPDLNCRISYKSIKGKIYILKCEKL